MIITQRVAFLISSVCITLIIEALPRIKRLPTIAFIGKGKVCSQTTQLVYFRMNKKVTKVKHMTGSVVLVSSRAVLPRF